MEQLFPTPRSIGDGEGYDSLRFPDPPSGRPYVILNFVLTADGQASLGAGGAAGIGSETDHRLMRKLRVTADALLHGAGTVRADNFRPTVPEDLVPRRLARNLEAQPLGVVVSRTGNLPAENRYFSARPPVVFTTNAPAAGLSARLGSRAKVLAMGEKEIDLGGALAMLRYQHGVRLLLCEGGPSLAYDLLAGGYLDELFLTLAPKLGADSSALRLLQGPAFPEDAVPSLTLRHVWHQDSELFLRYTVRR
jgi:2,5-diamino-6-(ribosylamino)-4(3H)-pyrimidinone 5'-phosphate reductase